MTDLYRETLADIVLNIDMMRAYWIANNTQLEGNARDKFLADLDAQYERLYKTVKELLTIESPF